MGASRCQLSRSGRARKINTPRITIVKRNASSCPFQLRDCHMARYSPATTRKPKNQTANPTVTNSGDRPNFGAIEGVGGSAKPNQQRHRRADGEQQAG